AVEGVVADGSSDAADAARLILHAPAEVQQQLAVQPSTVFWTSLTTKNMQGLRLTSVDSTPLDRQDSYLTDLVAWSSSGIPQAPRIHRNDLLLRLPFGKKISFE